MLLASVAFVIAAFVQLEIDVSAALAAARTRTLRPFDSISTVSFSENAAKLPSSLGEPSEVHQHAGQEDQFHGRRPGLHHGAVHGGPAELGLASAEVLGDWRRS